MENWAKNVKWKPVRELFPNTIEEIKEYILEATRNNETIRPIGSGHSFSPLCSTSGYLLCLDNMQKIEQDKLDKFSVHVQAGAKLYQISDELNKLGLAQENMGDIDRQSISGATSTGTHGTGIKYGNISTQIEELTFVNGLGEIIKANNSNPTLFNSAKIALGSLGVVTNVKLKVIPAYLLKQEKKKEKLQDIIKNIDAITENNRQFEFHWFPHTDVVQTKYINVTNQEITNTNKLFEWFNEIVFENYFFELVNVIAKIFPSKSAFINRLITKLISSSTKINLSSKVFSSKRTVRFYETEYNIPYEHYPSVVEEILNQFDKKKYKIIFPQEHRFVQEDDIYLSPAYKRKSAYIAVHAYIGTDYEEYFNDMQEIFKRYDGRPHWGKMHNCNATYLAKVYPEWNTFLNERKKNDPNGVFLNDHLKSLFD